MAFGSCARFSSQVRRTRIDFSMSLPLGAVVSTATRPVLTAIFELSADCAVVFHHAPPPGQFPTTVGISVRTAITFDGDATTPYLPVRNGCRVCSVRMKQLVQCAYPWKKF